MKQGPVVPVAMFLDKLKRTWTNVRLLKKLRALSSRNGHCATNNKDIGQITRSPDHYKGFNPNSTGGGAVHRPSTFSILTFLVIMVEAKKKHINLSFDNAETMV